MAQALSLVELVIRASVVMRCFAIQKMQPKYLTLFGLLAKNMTWFRSD